MSRFFALLLALAVVPACEHMGKGGGGGSSFGHSSYGGSSGPGGHAPSSALSHAESPGPSSSSSSRPSHASLASRTEDGVASTAAEVGWAMLEGALLSGEETVTVTPTGAAPDPDVVGDLCLDCPDAGNCDSCPGPRGAP